MPCRHGKSFSADRESPPHDSNISEFERTTRAAQEPFQLDEGPSLSCLKSHAGSSEGSGIPKTEQGFKNKVCSKEQ